MKDVSGLLPIPGAEPNIHHFRGTVNRVRREDDLLRYEPWWSLKVTVFRLGKRKDIEIGVVLTKTILGKQAPPGEDAEVVDYQDYH